MPRPHRKRHRYVIPKNAGRFRVAVVDGKTYVLNKVRGRNRVAIECPDHFRAVRLRDWLNSEDRQGAWLL